MISKITGTLEELIDAKASLALPGGLTYQVLLPAYAAARLGDRIGRELTLHTLHYLEGSSQSSSFIPRLAGFLAPEDRAFFELFTTVKGIGPRKALRALAMDSASIAAAIAERDVRLLQTLPEIGKRMAETVVATLHGKVDHFITPGNQGRPATAGATTAAPVLPEGVGAQVLQILLQLGENRQQAQQWVEQAMIRKPGVEDVQELLAVVFKIRGGP